MRDVKRLSTPLPTGTAAVPQPLPNQAPRSPAPRTADSPRVARHRQPTESSNYEAILDSPRKGRGAVATGGVPMKSGRNPWLRCPPNQSAPDGAEGRNIGAPGGAASALRPASILRATLTARRRALLADAILAEFDALAVGTIAAIRVIQAAIHTRTEGKTPEGTRPSSADVTQQPLGPTTCGQHPAAGTTNVATNDPEGGRRRQCAITGCFIAHLPRNS